MVNDDHQKIIDDVIALARRQLKQNGMLDFTVLTIDEQGLTTRRISTLNSSAAKRTKIV
jgi:hypothetical protein